jgi:flagellar export protein FliJ
MMKSKRFEPIQEIAANSADQLSRAMADAGLKVTDLERQLERLQSYRDEYLRSSGPAAGSTDAVKLQNYSTFMERLGEALRQHLKNLDNARAEYEKRVEAESLSRVVARLRQEERHAADRREQREGDDAALRVSMAARDETGNY